MLILTDKNIEYLIGSKQIVVNPIEPYNNLVISFLSELSKLILSDKIFKKYSDAITFGFWCRKNNIEQKKKIFKNNYFRIGYGLVFHIVPSNIPINFLYSFAFGLLSGNSNIIRMPTKEYPQVKIILNTINKIFNKKKYLILKKSNIFIKYKINNEITSEISNFCNARIIWGGDNTIDNITKFKISHKAFDIKFPDRYSICIINTSKVLSLKNNKLRLLAKNFYNDTYLSDQNACSSPHAIFWLGKDVKKAQNLFWTEIEHIVKLRYKIPEINLIDKNVLMLNNAINFDNLKLTYKSNYLIRVEILKLNNFNTNLRGFSGLFYEHEIKNINNIAKIISPKFQTLLYYGFDKKKLLNFVKDNNLLGIDRIVKIGNALNIDILWDGHDIVSKLSRIVIVE